MTMAQLPYTYANIIASYALVRLAIFQFNALFTVPPKYVGLHTYLFAHLKSKKWPFEVRINANYYGPPTVVGTSFSMSFRIV